MLVRIVVEKRYLPIADVFELRHTVEFDKEDDQYVRRIVERDFKSVNRVFRRHFRTHESLYHLVNPKYISEEYDPSDSHFDSNIRGYSKFMEDLSQSEVERIGVIICDLIKERLTYIEMQYGKQHDSRIVMSLRPNVPEHNALDEIKKITPATLIVDNKVYAMDLKAIEGVETYEDMRKDIYKTIREDYDAQFKAAKSSYEFQLTQLRKKLEKEKEELFVDVLQNAKEILNDWSFEEINDQLYLRYKKKVVVNKVTIGQSTYTYPGDLDCKEIYVSGLKVRVTAHVSDYDVIVTRGFHLHFNGKRGCIGGLSGKPLIRVLRELPKSLETANMNSPLNGEVRDHIRTKFLARKKELAVEDDLGW
jgi:hypothetical protein